MRNHLTVTALAAILALGGCANMNEVQRGTATGAGVGGGIGAVLGAATGGGGGKRAATGAVLMVVCGVVTPKPSSRPPEPRARRAERYWAAGERGFTSRRGFWAFLSSPRRKSC